MTCECLFRHDNCGQVEGLVSGGLILVMLEE